MTTMSRVQRQYRADELGLGEYEYCVERDAEHDPIPAAAHDREMPEGYLTIECAACGQTTGYPMPRPEDIDWG